MTAVKSSPQRTAALRERVEFLSSLRVGDEVILRRDGGDLRVTVQRAMRGADPDGSGALVCGSLEHSPVTIGFGVGRWNREVTAADLLPTAAPFHGNGLGLSRPA